MGPMEVLKRLPELIAQAEDARGTKLTEAEIGQYLIELGETIKKGGYRLGDATGFLATDPLCTNPPTDPEDVICTPDDDDDDDSSS